jgi:hypothetical protein
MTNYTPEEILKAIDECRVHWRNMQANRECGERPYADDCALCRMFVLNPKHNSCDGCPIKERTEQHGCMGTPYDRACGVFFGGTDYEWNSASQAMIDFLDETRKEFLTKYPNLV